MEKDEKSNSINIEEMNEIKDKKTINSIYEEKVNISHQK
mgnify:CR=1 FL=1